tara:strand:- start:1138 stop:2208 length:1071 start_codon:yes stop_codon:yes gene_type:complete
MTHQKPRLLTGDTPTGKLHLGHWVGSLENRVALQDDYDCYFILANMHAFTTQANNPKAIRENTLAITLDYLSAGVEPSKSNIFIQSEVPAIAELTFLFSMLLPYSRVMRNPTIKDEIRDKGLGNNYSFGFPLYSVGQTADILAFRPEIVPVGEDQEAHLEMTREVARKFNQLYCHVDPHESDADALKAGGLFPITNAKLGRIKRLVGTGGPTEDGRLLKMSKSLNNAIFLSDTPDVVRKKIMSMYTDPNRLRATDPGTIENNPLWLFHDAFTKDSDWLMDAKQRYQEGSIGDVDCKKQLIDSINQLLEPMHQKRKDYESEPDEILAVLKRGTEKANDIANDTLAKVKCFIKQDYFI